MSPRFLLLALAVAAGVASAPAVAEPTPAAPAAAPESTANDVDGWLAKLTSADPASRRAALSALDTANPAMLPAITRRLSELKKTANRDAMANLLAGARVVKG